MTELMVELVQYTLVLNLYYCRVSIKSTPLRDRDTPDEILVSSPCLEGRDMRKISSGVAAKAEKYLIRDVSRSDLSSEPLRDP